MKLRDGAVRHIRQARCCVEDCPNIIAVEGEWADYPYETRLPHNTLDVNYLKKAGTGWCRSDFYTESTYGVGRYAVFCPEHAPAYVEFRQNTDKRADARRQARKSWWMNVLRPVTELFFPTPPEPPLDFPYERTEKMSAKAQMNVEYRRLFQK